MVEMAILEQMVVVVLKAILDHQDPKVHQDPQERLDMDQLVPKCVLMLRILILKC